MDIVNIAEGTVVKKEQRLQHTACMEENPCDNIILQEYVSSLGTNQSWWEDRRS